MSCRVNNVLPALLVLLLSPMGSFHAFSRSTPLVLADWSCCQSLGVQMPNVELKQWGHTNMHSTSCGEDRPFWAGSKAGEWMWSKPDLEQLIIMPMAGGVSGPSYARSSP